MRFSSILASAGLLGSALAGVAPRSFSIPDRNGFPAPNAAQEQLIALQAGGKLPGGALPTSLGPGSTTAFQLIAFNELFETAYFESLLTNITRREQGYRLPRHKHQEAKKIVKTVLAQEEQHAIGALATLASAKQFAPSPCKYQFPVDNLRDAISLAETFTAVVLGALQDANVIFSSEGLPEVVRLVSSVIGQEGEQNGFYRVFLDQVPSESPFLTTVPAAFAWSALQLFVVPGSCPYDLSNVNLPIFPALSVNGGAVATIEAKDQVLTFQADLTDADKCDDENLYITYNTGKQLPISVKAENVQWISDTVIKVEANFPFTENVMAGFSHAALTNGGNFTDVNAVVANTLAAPGLIQVVDKI